MKKIIQLILFTLVFFQTIPCFAQFTATIGTANFTGQTFSCRTYSNKEDIIITAKGKSRTVSKNSAKSQGQKTLKNISRKINDTNGAIKEKNARLKKLFKSVVPTPAIVDEIKLTQDQVALLTARRDLLKSQQGQMKSIIAGINNCGKGPLIGNGSMSIYNLNGILPKTGWTAWAVLAAYVFPVDTNGFPNRIICVSVNDAPPTQKAFNTDVCQTHYDGFFTDNPTALCAGIPAGHGAIIFGGGSGKRNTGGYDEALEKATAALSTKVIVSAPKKDGSC